MSSKGSTGTQTSESPDTQQGTFRSTAPPIPALLRGEPDALKEWVEQTQPRGLGFCVGVIFIGAGLFGFAMGWWRSPLQAGYTALKFPLIIMLTTVGNGLLNAMLAPLLGLNIPFRQSLLALLISFTIAAVILCGFSPLIFFLIWNAPPLSAGAEQSWDAYSFIQLALVIVIAFAGIAANLRLIQLLNRLSGSVTISRRVLFAWLAGNLFLGSHLSWNLRPFIGSPGLPVQFVRPDALHGNFYEAVFHSLSRVLH